MTQLANHYIILRIEIEILQKVLKCFLLVGIRIYVAQSAIGLAELRINLDDPSEAVNCFGFIRAFEFKPIAAVAFIIVIAIIDAS